MLYHSVWKQHLIILIFYKPWACGLSFDLTVKHKIYSDIVSRGHSHFDYLGIYRNKAVRFIGEVENIIVANYTDDKGLIVKDQVNRITDYQKSRIIEAIKDSHHKGWHIYKNNKFFLFKDLYETTYIKISPKGLFRVKYFDLEKILSNKELKDVETIADALKNRTWE